MNKQQINILFDASHALSEVSNMAKNNLAVLTPLTHQEYSKLANDILEVIKENK